MGEERKIVYPELYRHFKGRIYATIGIVIGITPEELADIFKKNNTTIGCAHNVGVHSGTQREIAVLEIGNKFYYLNKRGDKEGLVMYRSIGTGKVWLTPLKMFAEEASLEEQERYGQKYKFQIVESKFVKSCYI